MRARTDIIRFVNLPARHRPAALGGLTTSGGPSPSDHVPGRQGAPARGRRSARAALLLACLFGAVVACGGSAAKPTPTKGPATSSPSADVRLDDPTSADDVYVALNAAGLGIVGTNAEAGTDPVKRINATYAGQPLVISGYSSDLARAGLDKLVDGAPPAAGQPPYTFAALNVVIELGSSTPGVSPTLPDAQLVASASTLADVLLRLLGPLVERSAQRVSPPPPATPAPSPKASPTPRASPTH